jgi:predicted metal-dependent hydrolase
MYAPMFLVKRMLKNSRDEIRKILSLAKPQYSYADGMTIGKSHKLRIIYADDSEFRVTSRKLEIVVKLPIGASADESRFARKIRDSIIAALRVEAKSYLPKRLSFLADKYGFAYEKVRFSHASGRWGSCSSNGTISLNIALMKLPFELIDYVIIHELSHTKQMNHSPKFWEIVASANPDYKLHRRELKLQNPTI